MKKLGEPEPDGDVINREPRVLLIGYGWVGQYMGKYFKTADRVDHSGYLVKQKYATYDLAIISVPTPMNPKTGQCDTSIVEDCVKKWKDVVDYFLIKSTVEIGTTDKLRKKYQVRIAMSPEYIGETLGHPLLEPRRDAFQIIGGKRHTREKIAEFFRLVLTADAPMLLCSAKEAEIIKYGENYFLMRTKDYWDDIFEICEVFKQSFTRVREGLVLDPRVGRTHSNIYPNNRGWSGKCLPKDMNALAYRMSQVNSPLTTLEQLIHKNANKWRKGYKDKQQLKPV